MGRYIHKKPDRFKPGASFWGKGERAGGGGVVGVWAM